MKRTLFILFITLCSSVVSAQTISLYFPHFAGAEYDFYLFLGVDSDTIQQGSIPEDGRLTLTFPDQYKGYTGMTRWLLRKGGGLNFIVNGEDFSVSCIEAIPNGANIIHAGSVENDYFHKCNSRQQELQQKIEAMRSAQRAYQTETLGDVYRIAHNELNLLNGTFSRFQQEKQESPLYAARYLRISDFMNYTPLYSLPDTEEEHKAEMLHFVENELKMDVLFTTGLWKDVILQSVGLYKNGDDFLSAMITKLRETSSLQVYEQLAEALISICETHSWNAQEEQLTYFLINDGRIKQPTGKVKQMMTLFKLTKGSKAPALSQGKLPKNKTLLIFHSSGCGNCELQMQQLKDMYDLLKKQGYEVVSVSADVDLAVFESESKDFPWKAKYCSGEGFAGVDFDNYGIIGTPTIFILDEKGIIQGRYARLEDTGILE